MFVIKSRTIEVAMAISASDVERILDYGAGVTVSANDYSATELKSFATSAKSQSVTLHVISARVIPVDELKDIATKGQGYCTFDLT